jgi:arylsulfatase A-like enzyme
VAWREYLFCEWNTSHTVPGPSLLFPQRCVRDARYKLIRNLLPGPNPTEEYYTTQALVATGANQAEIDVAPEAVQAAYATWRNAPPVELYDLHADPNEQTNLADRPELAAVQSRLLAELEAWQRSTRDPLADPRRLAQLVAEDQDRAQTVGQQQRKPPWRYPQYLYGR